MADPEILSGFIIACSYGRFICQLLLDFVINQKRTNLFDLKINQQNYLILRDNPWMKF